MAQKRKAIREWLSRADGATAIEFALVAPILVALLLSVVQIGLVFLAKAYLETTAEKSARYMMTNQAVSLTQAQFTQVVCGYIGALFNCNNIIVQVQPAPTSAAAVAASLPQFNSAGNLLNPASYSTTTYPNNAMVTVMYEFPVFAGPLGAVFSTFTNGTLLMTSTQIFPMEPATN